MCGSGGAVRILPTLAYGLAQIRRKVKNELAVDDHVVVGLLQVAREHFCECCKQLFTALVGDGMPTIASSVQVDDAPYAHVDDAQKALILFLELLLVKDLYGEHTILGHPPASMLALLPPRCSYVGMQRTHMSKLSFQ